mgnify:CR=1 FL=1
MTEFWADNVPEAIESGVHLVNFQLTGIEETIEGVRYIGILANSELWLFILDALHEGGTTAHPNAAIYRVITEAVAHNLGMSPTSGCST